jgi:hypothetical protein
MMSPSRIFEYKGALELSEQGAQSREKPADVGATAGLDFDSTFATFWRGSPAAAGYASYAIDGGVSSSRSLTISRIMVVIVC